MEAIVSSSVLKEVEKFKFFDDVNIFADNNKLTLVFESELGITVVKEVSAKVNQKGSMLLKFDEFLTLVKNAVEICLDSKNHKKPNIALDSLKKVEIKATPIVFDVKTFKYGIDLALSTLDKHSERSYQTKDSFLKVLFKFGKDLLTIIATDASRLAITNCSYACIIDIDKEFIIDRKAVWLLRRIFIDEMRCFVGENKLYFRYQNTLIILKDSKKEEYVNYHIVLSEKVLERAIVSKTDFLSALQHIRTDRVCLMFSGLKQQLKIKYNSLDDKEPEITIPATVKRIGLTKLFFNRNFLVSYLKLNSGDIIVSEMLAKSLQILSLTASNHKDSKYIMAGMRRD